MTEIGNITLFHRRHHDIVWIDLYSELLAKCSDPRRLEHVERNAVHPMPSQRLWQMGKTWIWGLSFKSVLPYFVTSEDILIKKKDASSFHSKGGPLGVTKCEKSTLMHMYIQAGKEAGFEDRDYNEMEGVSVSKMQLTVRDGIRGSTGLEFTGRVMERPNFHLSLRSWCTWQ